MTATTATKRRRSRRSNCGRSAAPDRGHQPGGSERRQPIWVDLIAPTKKIRGWIGSLYDVDLPDPGSLTDLEASARFYVEDDGDTHLHSDFLLDTRDESRNVPVALILHNDVLFTVRSEELPVFRLQRARARTRPGYVTDGKDVLLDLYAADVEYSANALEDVYGELDESWHDRCCARTSLTRKRPRS
jgi:magnesium transporter